MDSKYIDILRAEMEKYSGEGLNSYSVFTENKEHSAFTSTTIYKDPKKDPKPFVDLLVFIKAEKIVIRVDQNDKPLVDALVQNGIPREKIILAYAGEAVPETIT